MRRDRLSVRWCIAFVPFLFWAIAMYFHQDYFKNMRNKSSVNVEVSSQHPESSLIQNRYLPHKEEPTVVPQKAIEQKLVESPENNDILLPFPNSPGNSSELITTDKCGPDRKPFHVLLTSEGSAYQEWQTRILYYHYQKIKKANPCSEMSGFTRVFSSVGGQPDSLMKKMPTFIAPSLPQDVHRGFHVINRPWSMLKFIQSPKFNEMVKEEYVYIMETDHLLLKDLPNLADRDTVAGFFFPYMDTQSEHLAKVASRFYKDGPVSDMYPTGPSPTIMHVDILKKVAQSWYDMSVDLKHDPEADRVFGWALEMWGYTVAAAKHKIKHRIIQQFQIEPSATWHQNVTAEDPYIFHYTFGHEYNLDGVPMVGQVGEWSLDKRRWTNIYPPLKLTPPPKCAGEATHILTSLFNEAMTALSFEWPDRRGTDTLLGSQGASTLKMATRESAPLMRVMTELGAWSIGPLKPVHFYSNFQLLTPEGSGSWSLDTKTSTVSFTLAKRTYDLRFEGDPVSKCLQQVPAQGQDACHRELKFTAQERKTNPRGTPSKFTGELIGSPAGWWSDASHASTAVVKSLTGSGPWAWQGTTPLAFLRGGNLLTPWGEGKWGPLQPDHSDHTFFMNFVGAEHDVTLGECNSFTSRRRGDGNEINGWMQIPIPCPPGVL